MPRKKESDDEFMVVTSVAMYKRLAVGFLAVTLCVTGVLLLVTFWTATITVIPARVPQEVTFRLVVAQGGAKVSGTVVPGAIDTALITGEATYPIAAEERIEGKSRGKVTIVNATSRPQPLVATTRFLAKEGILFRLERAVTVPAKGSVEGTVVADAPGAQGDLPPTRFTIPGLSSQLQQVISGESKESFRGGVTMIGVVSSEQNALAIAAAKDAALKAFADAHPEERGISTFDRNAMVQSTTDAKAGDRRTEIHTTAQLRITRVRVPTEYIEQVAMEQLRAHVGDRVQFVALPLTVQPTLDAVDTKNGRAALTVHAVGYSAFEKESRALTVDQFAGKSRAAIRAQLRALPGIANVHVTIHPFFMWWTPFLKDHVTVEVKQQ